MEEGASNIALSHVIFPEQLTSLQDFEDIDSYLQRLAEILRLHDYRDNARSAILLDFYCYLLEFAKENHIDGEKTCTLISLLKQLHERSVASDLSMKESFDLFKKTIIQYSTVAPHSPPLPHPPPHVPSFPLLHAPTVPAQGSVSPLPLPLQNVPQHYQSSPQLQLHHQLLMQQQLLQQQQVPQINLQNPQISQNSQNTQISQSSQIPQNPQPAPIQNAPRIYQSAPSLMTVQLPPAASSQFSPQFSPQLPQLPQLPPQFQQYAPPPQQTQQQLQQQPSLSNPPLPQPTQLQPPANPPSSTLQPNRPTSPTPLSQKHASSSAYPLPQPHPLPHSKLAHSYTRPQPRGTQFTPSEIRALTKFLIGSYYQHYALYKNVFTREQEIDEEQRFMRVETAVIPPPLSQAMTEQEWAYLQSKEQQRRIAEELSQLKANITDSMDESNTEGEPGTTESAEQPTDETAATVPNLPTAQHAAANLHHHAPPHQQQNQQTTHLHHHHNPHPFLSSAANSMAATSAEAQKILESVNQATSAQIVQLRDALQKQFEDQERQILELIARVDTELTGEVKDRKKSPLRPSPNQGGIPSVLSRPNTTATATPAPTSTTPPPSHKLVSSTSSQSVPSEHHQ